MLPDSVPNLFPELSIIIPMYNEARNVAPMLARLVPVLENCVESFEIVFVDDGSTDDTLEVLRACNSADSRVTALSFSRNFGKEIAIAAGLDNVQGRAAVIMDADLQHPPETIPHFVEKWREGFKSVYGVRRDRAIETPLRRLLVRRFYGMFDTFGEMSLPHGAGDFRLLDAQAVEALRSMGERARFSKGLYAWIGYKAVGVPYVVEARASGTTKFSYRKLTRFALDGIMSFSTLPLRVWSIIGLAVSVFAFLMALYFLARTLLYGIDVPGFATLIVSLLFFSGIQLLSLGVLGEYIGRIFAEVKRRPLYLVAERIGQTTPRNA